eukprot:GHVR01174950.1.p1 GENE.GHVR01174950.1~~GHVR01174950.1.p1  ORF type:complete len:335 (-),score=45.79 GHVR01174950.1:114-1118(-)
MQPGFKVASRAMCPVPIRPGANLLRRVQTAAARTDTSLANVQQDCIHVLSGHLGYVSSLQVAGDVLFTASQDSNIMIWDLNNLQYIGHLPAHKGLVRCLASSYCRKLLFSGSQDRTIKAWSLETFSVCRTLRGHTGEVMCLLVIEERETLVSGSEDKSIRLWCLNNLNPLLVLEDSHSAGVHCLSKLNIDHIVSGSRDKKIKVWSTISWDTARSLHPPHYDCVTSFAVSTSGHTFYSASRDKSIKEWEVDTLESTAHAVHVHADWIQALAYSPTLALLYSASKDCTIKAWDQHLNNRLTLVGHTGPVTCMLPLNDFLFTGSHDRTVRVWKPRKN